MPSLRPHAKHASRVCPFHSVSDGETLGVRETQSLVRVPWCICVRVKIPGFLVLLYHCSGCWGWNPALPSPGSPKSDALVGPKFDLQRSPSLSQGVRHLTKGRGTCWRLSWLFSLCKHFCGSPLSLRGSSLWLGGRDQTGTSWEGNLPFFFLDR